MLPVPLRSLGALQRVALVALLTPVVLIAVIAAIPALMLLPFIGKGGTERVVSLLTAYTTYVSTLLSKSRTEPEAPSRR